ncbi:MAG: cobalamin-binding protein [Ignavibacteria bacterium]
MSKSCTIYILTVSLLAFSLSPLLSCNRNHKIPTASTISVTDDLNEKISFSKTPQRVISLAPNLTEMIYALAAGNKLVGNTLYCNYPSEAKSVTKTGDMITLDYERILALKPDLILITVEGNAKDSYKRLRDLDLKVFVSNPRDFSGIKKTFSDLGSIFRMKTVSDSIIKGWDDRYNKIITEIHGYKKGKGMFLVALSPVMIAGKNTFINELITSAGIENIASDSKLNYPIFNREEILKRNPDYIITTDESKDIKDKLLKNYPEWRTLNAVRNDKIITGDPDLFLRPGPRFISAVEYLFNKLNHQN